MCRQIPILLVILLVLCGCRKNETSLMSPDGSIRVDFALDSIGKPQISVSVDGNSFVVVRNMGFTTVDSLPLFKDFELASANVSSTDEEWTQPWGENKVVRDSHNELLLNMKNDSDVHLGLRIRAFDDGVGFRYEYDLPLRADSIVITDELTSFCLAEDGTAWAIYAAYDTYELEYRTLPISKVDNAATPMTFKTASGLYGSIHEAALTDFPEMMLYQNDSLELHSVLSKLPDSTKAVVPAKFVTPWRTLQVGRKAVDLVNSSLILNLNEPCKLESTDWIHPMKYVGVWWGMHLGIESWTEDERHGATTENAIRYIDFAAGNNIDAVLFEGWNKGWDTWGDRPNFDFTCAASDFDVDSVLSYAENKGVKVICHHETGGNVPAYERQLDAAYSWCADKGYVAVKTGYAGGFPDGYSHHGQYAVRHYRRVVETAAKYHLMLDVHEPIKATGIRRTYPNMMTREGARGMEWNAWSDGNKPEHHVILPFTRLLGGPMDYTPGTFDVLFDCVKDNPNRRKWNGKDSKDCRVNTTLAKQIANWVILYSPMQMASDLIENYEGHPAFQFFKDFDPDCDWSKALDGEVGDYIVVVRRAGETFFLGAATDETARTVSVSLDFLEAGKIYEATIYADGDDADWVTNPTSYKIERQKVSSADSLPIRMAAGGGMAVVFKEKAESF